MAAPTGYPSWAYNSTQLSSLIVQNAAAFNALSGPGIWTTTPFNSATNPFDPNEQITDTFLKNVLIELRAGNYMQAQAFGITEDYQSVIRPDVAVNDVALTSL